MFVWSPIATIPGWLSPNEGRLLYKLASKLKPNSLIVEIGSYCGKSTMCLAQGALQSNSRVLTIDHHKGSPEIQEDLDSGIELQRTLERFKDRARVQACTADSTSDEFLGLEVDLIFIDGDHRVEAVERDVLFWTPMIIDSGSIAFHDYQSFGQSGPTVVVQHMMRDGWQMIERADSLVALTRR